MSECGRETVRDRWTDGEREIERLGDRERGKSMGPISFLSFQLLPSHASIILGLN